MANSDTFKDPNRVLIPFGDCPSDGDSKKRPNSAEVLKWDYREFPDSGWREGLADFWMEEIGAAKPGKKYVFDRLPPGFCLFDRHRQTGNNNRDKFLFGHSGGFVYQRPTEFFPHLFWLKTGRVNFCECLPCARAAKGRGPATRRTRQEMRAFRASQAQEGGRSLRTRRNQVTNAQEQEAQEMNTEEEEAEEMMTEEKGTQEKGTRVKATRGRPRKKKADDDRPLQLPRPLDSKGNMFTPKWDDNWPMTETGPNYWKIHIQKMKDEGKIDEELEHFFNFDWFASHSLMEPFFTKMALEPAFLPRQGELVLFCLHYEGTINFNEDTRAWEILSPDNVWQGRPEWHCGLIAQTPEEKCGYMDILEDTEKISPLRSVWGFRVEMLADPIGTNKDFSTRYYYLALKCIRPFNDWSRYLHGLPREAWQPSIEYGLTVMASWCCVSFTRFVGTWPDANIHARACWIGAEQIIVGDTIRLKPMDMKYEDTIENGIVVEEDPDPVDVMVVKHIALNLQGCRPDPKDVCLSDSARLLVCGKVFTRDKNRLSRPSPYGNAPLVELTPGEADATFKQVHMRHYGPWYKLGGGDTFGVNNPRILGRCYEPPANDLYFDTRRLDYDMSGVLNARRYSGLVDRRIPPGIEWFWGNCRVEILGLTEFNGTEVGPTAEMRQNPARWQAFLKIHSGRVFTEEEWDTAELPRGWGNSKKREWRGVDREKMIRVPMTSDDEDSEMEDEDEEEEEYDEEDEEDEEAEAVASRERGLLGQLPFSGGEEEEKEKEIKEEFDEEAANELLREKGRWWA